MYCICMCCYCCTQYSFHIKVTILSRCLSYTYTLISQLRMKCFLIRLRISCNCLYTHFPTGSYYSNSYFASVRYQYLIKHSFISL